MTNPAPRGLAPVDVPGDPRPVVAMHDIHKRFGHVIALRGASFDVYPGCVNALVGDNGAGKSTLIKILAGALKADSGEILFEGSPISFDSPIHARELGIETVYQDLALCTLLDPAANVFLGREVMAQGPLGRWFGFLDSRTMQKQTQERLADLRIDLGPARKAVETLSGGQRQAVAIARAISWSRKVLILDEPTAALGVKETALVLELIRRVRDSGIGVVLIMHNLTQVFEIADRITVLRLGRDAGASARTDVTMADTVALMSGLTAGPNGTMS